MGTQSHCPVVRFAEPLLSIDFPRIHLLSLSGEPSSSGTSHIRRIAQGRRKKQKNVRAQGMSYRLATSINVLPDNVLLEIFDFYRKSYDRSPLLVWKWHFLVHICQRWRQVVFASSKRLKLQILCSRWTPVRQNLGIWPVFPIVVDYHYSGSGSRPRGEDNAIAALKRPDRVCYVRLNVIGSQLGRLVTVMQEPFPVLTHLDMDSNDGNAPVFPAEFLGGSAPCLQNIRLYGIPFPALPTLLLSASDLVSLNLLNIPPTGYISPKTMVTSLATLSRLTTFTIEFELATPRPRIHPPPVTRTVLPALTYFQFKGASEYLEDLIARIDTPQLDRVDIDYLNQLVDFQVPQLSKFIDRSVLPELTLCKHAEVTLASDWVSFATYRHHVNYISWDRRGWRPARTIISCEGIDWQVSHISQVLNQFSTTLSIVSHLRLTVEKPRQLEGADDIEWLRFLLQFSTMQTLHVSSGLAGHVALALEHVTGEMVAEVLPLLDLIYLADQPASSIEKFTAARRLSGRPVTVVGTERAFNVILMSYAGK